MNNEPNSPNEPSPARPANAPPVPVPPPVLPAVAEGTPTASRYSKLRVTLAFAIAGMSDVASVWIEFIPPLQWTLDIATALLLFAVLGKRWLILPGLIAEAIPGLAVFPVWVLVVAAIFAGQFVAQSKRN